MPSKKSSQQKSATAATTTATPSAATTSETPAKQRRPRKGAESTVSAVVTTTENSPTAESTGPKTRVVPTHETVDAQFQTLITSIEDEVKRMNAASNKGTKFLRTVNKALKSLRSQVSRISRKRTGTRRNNQNSGFRKEAQISAELAKFTGWDQKLPRSRVDVTKFICQYIKDNKLQDEKDGRIILPDNKLRTLLNVEAGKVLKYPTLQTYLKNHFTKLPSPAATLAATPAAPSTAPVAATPSAKRR